jgi:hypothetical protein
MMGGDECEQLLISGAKAFDTFCGSPSSCDPVTTNTWAVDASVLSAVTKPTICSTGKVHCHDLDTTALIMKQLALDCIQPLQAANERIAKAIVDLTGPCGEADTVARSVNAGVQQRSMPRLATRYRSAVMRPGCQLSPERVKRTALANGSELSDSLCSRP